MGMKKSKLLQFAKKKRELISYGIFGVATTVVNIVLYQVFLLFLDYRISNLIAIIGAKVFAYLVNKVFVFRTKCRGIQELLGEIVRFVFARGFTGLVDYFGLIFLVEVFHWSKSYAKYTIQFLVIILNYVFGKKLVFTTQTEKSIHHIEGEEK